MNYQHINNLYNNREIIENFKKVYALEKIDGTSASIEFFQDNLNEKYDYLLKPGSGSLAKFTRLTEEVVDRLFQKFPFTKEELRVTVYGEFYGGKIRHGSRRYGPEEKFVAFDVELNGVWLDVDSAKKFCDEIGQEFVHYELVDTEIDILEALCKAPSVQAKRNGITEDVPREGIVLRTYKTLIKNNGDRVCAKHKNPKYRETVKKRELSQEKLDVLNEAEEVANEWVTEMRFNHVSDHLKARGVEESTENTVEFMKGMLEDIKREGSQEIKFSSPVNRAINTATAKMLKARLVKTLLEKK